MVKEAEPRGAPRRSALGRAAGVAALLSLALAWLLFPSEEPFPAAVSKSSNLVALELRELRPKAERSALMQRYRAMKREYLKALDDAGSWRHLHSADNTTLSLRALRDASGGKGTPYVRTEGVVEAPAWLVNRVMDVDHWNEHQPRIDPFFSRYRELRRHGNVVVGRRETSRLIIYRARELPLAFVREPVGRRGVFVSGFFSVTHPQLPPMKHKVRALQEAMCFFTPVRGEDGREWTKATMVTRIQLKGNVPMGFFYATAGRTGVIVMNRIRAEAARFLRGANGTAPLRSRTWF